MKHLVITVAALALLLIPSSVSAATLTISTSEQTINYGQAVSLSGSVSLDTPATSLVVDSRQANSAWSTSTNVEIDPATGTWSLTQTPQHNLRFRIRTIEGSVVSETVLVRVRPIVKITTQSSATPFYGVRTLITVQPASFSGRLKVRSEQGSRFAAKTVNVIDGRARPLIPTNGVGRFTLKAATVSSAQFDSGASALGLEVRGRVIKLGAKGIHVRALMARLQKLGFLTARRHTHAYDTAASQTVMAFQKSYGLPRTYTWGQREWKKLTTITQPLSPRASHPGTYIEVNKKLQTMLIARDGVTLAVVAVSTGATGNTPVGRFRIISRGDSPLYRFMRFIGNFGIHGYPHVPPYPASHGCVRVPNWIADWVWANTRVGTPITVYEN